MKNVMIILALLIVMSGCTTNSEWGYGEENGPDQWSSLSDEYETCSSGSAQSPIDIKTNEVESAESSIEFSYMQSSFNVVDTGHSVEFEDESGQNNIVYNDEQYTLQQIHFHNQSENTIDGNHYPLEGHFVHTNEAGENLVISVMFETGANNDVIGDNFTKVGEEVEFDPSALVPSEQSYYSFMGSLTTPPCSENVKWVVFEQPQSISNQQLTEFKEYYTDNNRDTQDLNGRVVQQN